MIRAPKKLVDKLNLSNGDLLKIYINGGGRDILIQKIK